MFNSIIPWKKREEHAIMPLRERMNTLFDDFFKDFHSMSPWYSSFEKSEFIPSIDVSENEKEVQINAELPGMTDKDIEVHLQNNTLVLKGEKKQEQEKKEKDYHHIERRYGSFYRSIPMPEEVETEKIEANFKNGVLNIRIPKNIKDKKETKIKIKTE